jgi:hypothetical protein
MPIYTDCLQRSEEWFWARCGLPTASDFSDLITPGGKPSKQIDGLLYKLLAESMMGHEIETPQSAWMLRGIELEPKAIAAYEFETGIETDRGGFVTNDEATYGCSPDRLVGADGLLEVKCPAPQTHMGYLLDPASMALGKGPQVYGQLCVCSDRKWVDLISYHPEMPLVIYRVERDDKYIGLLASALDVFVPLLRQTRQRLEEEYGAFPDNEPMNPGPEDDGLGITDADVDAILAHGGSVPQDRRVSQ